MTHTTFFQPLATDSITCVFAVEEMFEILNLVHGLYVFFCVIFFDIFFGDILMLKADVSDTGKRMNFTISQLLPLVLFNYLWHGKLVNLFLFLLHVCK